MEQLDIKELIQQQWKPIQTMGVLDNLLKSLNFLVADEEMRFSYQVALVDSIQHFASLLDEKTKSENAEYLNVLITSRERLLRM